MKPNDAFRRIIVEINDLKESMRMFQKRKQHILDTIRVEIGPDQWDVAFRIAAFLALKEVVLVQDDNEIGGKEIEFE